MSKEILRKKIHEMVDAIEDEAALNVLLEDAEVYTKPDAMKNDGLTPEQWSVIEQAREQIKSGQFKTYAAVKEHFAEWLTK